MEKTDAVSSAVGIVLMLSLVAVLCAIVAASLSGVFTVPAEFSKPIPESIALGEIHHENPAGAITYAGRLYLIHVGTEALDLAGHRAEVYVNGVKQWVMIETLKGSDFIPTHHYGVGQLAGPGVRGDQWFPGQWAWVNIGDQIILENDQVVFDVIRKSDGTIISRSVKTAPSIQR
ncbi:MAG: type IV pilin [Methanocorpusculum sp.]|nr:type IV pilin [Methanocorpusculum sp.]MDE2523119.1 type IV pilin [Methanocorpusculum sp.]MDE2525171.1 type IV pilin [Methanocorpusculum sp.]